MLEFIDNVVEYTSMARDKYNECPPKLFVPNVIDIEVTGRCEFSCPNCWGSKPCDYEKELTTKQWLKLFEKIDDYSFFDRTSRIAITGGEPLLRKDLIKLVNGLSDDGDRQISLSTTGLDRYNLLEKILNQLTSIGIPIDGPSPDVNSGWRNHNNITDGGLVIALESLKLIQKNAPNLYTSVRTLIHRDNINKIAEIPKFLEESGIYIARLRWVLYELCERKTSDREFSRLISTRAIESFAAGSDNFKSSMEHSGRGFKEVIIRTIGEMAYRNFIINPNGETRAIVPSNTNGEVIEFEFGNLHKDFNGTMELYNSSEEKYFFSLDARCF